SVSTIPSDPSTICTYTCQCTGASSSSLWRIYDPNTITMDINITNCSLSEMPVYFTGLVGTSMHSIAVGYNAIYSSTINFFRVFAYSMQGQNSTTMLSYAQANAWSLNWFGMY
ncbi:unnamed protein product, partial [Rotaria magnacalcarata]